MTLNDIPHFIFIFYAPPSAVQACKDAIFNAGGGRYSGFGNYTECCWSTAGVGQFRPGDSANPYIGQIGSLEETPEIRVEIICESKAIVKQVIIALMA